MTPARSLFNYCSFFGDRSDRPFQYVEELLNSSFFPFGEFALAAKEPRIKFGGKQSILKAFDHPINDGNHHLHIKILSEVAALDAEADKFHRAVWVLGDQETIDFAFENEIRTVVPEQVDPVRDPVLMNQMLGTDQPVAQDFKKALVTDIIGDIQIT